MPRCSWSSSFSGCRDWSPQRGPSSYLKSPWRKGRNSTALSSLFVLLCMRLALAFVWQVYVFLCLSISLCHSVFLSFILLPTSGYMILVTIFPGATKIIPLYKDAPNNTTVVCDPEFYDFYYHAKIAQLVVFMPYAAYNLITWVLLLGTQSEYKCLLSKLLWNFL